MTIWKPIPGHPKHEASDDGRIQTVDYETTYITKAGTTVTRHFKGRILNWRMGKPSFKGVKHPVVNIYKGTGRGDFRNAETRIAYLVAAAFYGIPWDNPADHMRWRIRFRDGNHLNCYAMNLEWVHAIGETAKQQEQYNRNKDAWEKRKSCGMPAWMTEMYDDEDAAA
ncbi:NUMOD4 domain-containing protein [Mycobacterium sp. AZCC_0083]|uniref:NUMOD4 domain-containing protein n=1 Tax=Mycobacterium sp. AZCC_0083 TaxID=2735882 RepID=UPI00160A1665|nr:hypothetical protein [Mycobacterium sp. AZCC_0083]MBB5167136.1 hypothetical protein [Mycobacterium sp. AZCC_0083]